MTIVKHSLSWLFLGIAIASLAIQWLQGIETGEAAWWALAILVSGEAAFVTGDARTRLAVGALITVALVGLLADTPGLVALPGRGILYLIGIFALGHIVMLGSGYGPRKLSYLTFA